MINMTGDRLALTREMSSIAMVSAIKNTIPSSEAATTDPTIARGDAARPLRILPSD
jgi:hypothetical protein